MSFDLTISKIDDLDLPIMKQDVCRFQVAVHNSFSNEAALSLENFSEKLQRFFLSKWSIEFDLRLQRASIAKFGDQEAKLIVLYHLDTPENMRVDHIHKRSFFHIQEILSDLVINGLEFDDLDCYLGLILQRFA